MSWLDAFLLTLAIEVPLAVVCLWAQPRGRVVAAAVLANTVSHPLLWFGFLRVRAWDATSSCATTTPSSALSS